MPVQVDVLLVDDDPDLRDLATRLLERRGMRVHTAEDAASARKAIVGFRGVLVLDVQLPDGDGRALLADARRLAPDAPVVFLTGVGGTGMAVELLSQGATDFLDKRDLGARLVDVVERAALLLDSDSEPERVAGIIGRSRPMRELFRGLQSVATAQLAVLVRGESGTGKELVARALHELGPRARGPFVAVNCAGIPDTLLEAELFGYERGAFTGAGTRKPGRFDLAAGGTIFLDEVGEMSPVLQAKVLRVLQNGEYQRLGGLETLRSDARVVAATHCDLESLMEEGRFRQDLYFRLAVLTLRIPPLRDRLGDVPLLASAFLACTASRERRAVTALDDRALELLSSYDYPGNVRELENLVSSAVVASSGAIIGMRDLPPAFIHAMAARQSASHAAARAAPQTLAEAERQQILKALAEARGNRAQAARFLGISRMTLYRKLKEMVSA